MVNLSHEFFIEMKFMMLHSQEFQRPSPYQSPDSISPFRSTFVSQRSIDSPAVNGYNSSRTSYQDYPTTRRFLEDQHEYEKAKADKAEAVQETSSRGLCHLLYTLYFNFICIFDFFPTVKAE